MKTNIRDFFCRLIFKTGLPSLHYFYPLMRFALFFLYFFSPLLTLAEGRKTLQTTFSSQNIKIDGVLNEISWKDAQIATSFTQTIPNPDKPSLFNTEVKVLYTKNSIIVGAKLFQPRKQGSNQISTRDQLSYANADVFSVYFDTYDDHQNGFTFKVSSAGVQQDERLSEGSQYGDDSWDAVWDVKTKIEDEYWIAEMEIPFSALRFGNQAEKKWGLNFQRSMRKLNETSYWNPINVQKKGFLIQTGQLVGLNEVTPPVRLFLFPYLSTGYLTQREETGTTKQMLRSGGVDIKYGINESFTLDMTLVPDFSQVVSDNLVRNLSPFEQQLNENRPFFTEGTELFNKDDLFYTRRIGNRPRKFYDVQNSYGDTSTFDIQKNPRIATLINAFKISGRTKNNVGIGLFNAVGAPMYAKVFDKLNDRQLSRINTEPLTNYNVLVVDKALKGQSSLTFTNTNVIRANEERDGNVSSLLASIFDKSEIYRVTAGAKMSVIHHKGKYETGSYVEAAFEKVSGKFSFSVSMNRMSKNYDKTDLGLQYDFNASNEQLELGYNENKPKSKYLQSFRTGINTSVWHNTSPFKVKQFKTNANLFLLFKNFWDINFFTELVPHRPVDFYQLGAFDKLLFTFPYWYNGINGSTDSRKKFFWAYEAGYGISNQPHSDYFNANQTFRYRFSTKLEMSVDMNVTRDNSNIGYAYYDAQSKIPVVGRRDQYEYSSQVNLRYNLNPFMNFTARFRHYNSFLSYNSFHYVEQNGEWKTSLLPFRNDLNENFNLQNIDIFYNWIFKPGSRLVLSYKQWLNNGYILNEQTSNRYFKNIHQVIQSPKSYEIAVRLIYFIDYNQLRVKKK
jgi:hypothetical protein